MSDSLAVVILAGGEGRRIGGGKPLRLLGGERLIDRALRLARGWSDCVAVAVRGEAQLGAIDAALILDEPAIAGPLAGLAAGLRFARSCGRLLLLTIPADAPFLPPDLAGRLQSAIADHGCALARSGGQLHPSCGLWRGSALDRLPSYLETGRRSLGGFAEMVGFAAAEWAIGSRDPFFNVNSAEDLAEAERQVR